MPAYIDRALLKDRVQVDQMDPLPNADLDRLIAVASQMVYERCVPFDETDPRYPNVQQVTLILAIRQRMNEVGNYTDEQGRPLPVKLWTSDLTDILGSLIADETPQTAGTSLPATGVMTRTTVQPVPHGWPDATAPRYGGSPYPRWVRR